MTDALAVNLESPCWNFQGMGAPYGRVQYEGKLWLAHRYMWTMMRGPIPEGMHVHHLCFSQRCVNPQHMMLVTRQEHPKHHLVTHCPQGHPLDAANTYPHITKDGRQDRQCRICRSVASKKYKAAHPDRVKAQWSIWWVKNKDERNHKRRKTQDAK